MDMTTLLILGGLALAVIVAALIVLRRSWGDFPDRAAMPFAEKEPSFTLNDPDRSQSVSTGPGPSQQREPLTLRDLSRADAEIAGREGWETIPANGLVLITQPMVRRAAQQALQRGGPQAKYFVSDGEQIYFSFNAIDDPVERQTAYELMRRFQAGEDVDFRAIMGLISKISKG